MLPTFTVLAAPLPVSSNTLKRAVCSPSSERWLFAESKPSVSTSERMFCFSSRIACSTGVRTVSVSSIGVPTGNATSTVNSPWCTSGSNSLSRPRVTCQVPQEQNTTTSTTANGWASAAGWRKVLVMAYITISVST